MPATNRSRAPARSTAASVGAGSDPRCQPTNQSPCLRASIPPFCGSGLRPAMPPNQLVPRRAPSPPLCGSGLRPAMPVRTDSLPSARPSRHSVGAGSVPRCRRQPTLCPPRRPSRLCGSGLRPAMPAAASMPAVAPAYVSSTSMPRTRNSPFARISVFPDPHSGHGSAG